MQGRHTYAIKNQRKARNASTGELRVPWADSLCQKRAGLATPWCPPIRAQYLDGSGPMRGLHSTVGRGLFCPADQTPRPVWRQVSGTLFQIVIKWLAHRDSPCVRSSPGKKRHKLSQPTHWAGNKKKLKFTNNPSLWKKSGITHIELNVCQRNIRGACQYSTTVKSLPSKVLVNYQWSYNQQEPVWPN